MSHIFGCKQTPDTPPTTSDEDSSGSTDDADMKKKKGNRAMGKKKYPKAIKYYTKAIKIDPKNPTYHLNRAIANSALELWKDAEVDASEAVSLQDETKLSSKSFYQLARARLKRGRAREAKEAVKIGLDKCPGEAALVQLNAEIERAVKKLEEKEKRAEEEAAKRAAAASAAGPGGAAKALTEKARQMYELGRFDEAVSLCNDACATATKEDAKRDEIAALSLLGKVHMRMKKWPESAKAWQNVVDLETSVFSMEVPEERQALSNAYNNLGIALKNAGKLNEAVDALNNAYQRATNGDDKVATYQASQILQNVGQTLLVQQKPSEAKAFFARAIDICDRIFGEGHASHAIGSLCLARCLRAEGELKESVGAYAKALKIFSEKPVEECLKELPEVPSKERLEQLQQQCKGELAQLLSMMEQAKAQFLAQSQGESSQASASGYTGSTSGSPESPYPAST
eukprot:TRINITY_DN37084_c0_g1_i1.p1 TRINITY_DN37084_c0_g1~~TRINITY_DN37084_c0_g1_i1.p1  ORF type:complete len:473 (-),score=140.68 TRINITY_DN37084_c0_g1_i1:132-1502(-)